MKTTERFARTVAPQLDQGMNRAVDQANAQVRQSVETALEGTMGPAASAYLETRDLSSPVMARALARTAPSAMESPAVVEAYARRQQVDTAKKNLQKLSFWLSREDRRVSPIGGAHVGPTEQFSAPRQQLEVVRRAFASGPAELFAAPLADVARLDRQLATELEGVRAGAHRPFLQASDLQSPVELARSLGALLESPQLAEVLLARVRTEAPGSPLVTALADFAMLADQALASPDYARTGGGWHYPASRGEVRRRDQQSLVEQHSAPRKAGTRTTLERSLTQALGRAEPVAAIESALVESFVSLVGVSAKDTRGWKPTLDGVRDAIKSELLIPLRALNETIPEMAPRHPWVRKDLASVIHQATQHIAQGDFRQWRATLPTSVAQLSVLNGAQRETWLRPMTRKSVTRSGLELVTREETGPELLWVTKIGGPSHGFDYGGHCLTPLLANARTTPILVEDPRYPENAAARSYLRLLSLESGEPVLYLEPLQRDFPHRGLFTERNEDWQVQQAILEHALAKARSMGVQLSLPPYLWEMVKDLGAQPRDSHERYELAASGGVFEASDTLTTKHDWPQMTAERTDRLERLLVS